MARSPTSSRTPWSKVLASWDWKQRPAAVVTMPSRTRQELITSLGQRISAIGRLPYLGALGYVSATARARGATTAPSASAALWRALIVPDELSGALKANGSGPVLLIDDQIDTGWTMTVATMLLRDAGAPAVLPLALAVTTG